MRLVRWERDNGTDRVDDYGFFERPLYQPHLFSFTTRSMSVSPHGGAFSLKATLRGREVYTFGARRLSLLPGEMILVEEGRTYGSEIREATQSLSLFLPRSWVGGLAASVQQGSRFILDNPAMTAPANVPAVPFRPSRRGRAALAMLMKRVGAEDAWGAEECAMLLVADALGIASSIRRSSGKLTNKRAGTREELLTRLRRAHDQIHDQAGLHVDLETLSNTACLSRFHFLRLFKQVYGQTPMRFAASIRLREAARLAAEGNIHAALALGGFRSKAAFRRAWRREGRRGQFL